MAQDNAPVINPADLAAIIAKSQTSGFSPSGPLRGPTGIVPGANFMPSNFESLARQAEPSSTEAPPQAPDPATKVKAPAFADIAPPPPKPARDFEAELASAFEKGRMSGLNEGKEIGRAEAQAQAQDQSGSELSLARDAFLAAAAAFSAPQDVLAASLGTGIEAAILRLASERAGMAIKENPVAFQRRIEALADRVAQGVRSVIVSLNPDDLAHIQSHLDGHKIDSIEFLPKAGMGHGDVLINARGICLSDLLHDPQDAIA